MDLTRVRERAARSAGVGGSRWRRTLGAGALRQGVKSAEGVRVRVE
jgi:hypothetical protein